MTGALAFHQQGQYEKAQEIYLKVLEVDPRNADALHLMGVIAHQRRNYLVAVEFIEMAIELKPKEALFYLSCGNSLKELNQIEKAIENYEKAIFIKPDFSDAHHNHALALSQLKKFDEAIRSFNQTIKYKPEFAEAYYNKGVVLQELNRFEAAINSYKMAIIYQPNYAEAYSNIGIILEENGRIEDALEKYVKAISLNQKYSIAYYNRANAYQKLKKYDASLQDYQKAIDLNPNSSDVFYNQGNLLRIMKQYEAAVQSYDSSISLNPVVAEPYCNKAISLYELSKYHVALENCNMALHLKSDYAEAHYNRGACLEKLKQLEAALESYERAYELNPQIDYLLGIKLQLKLSLCDWSNLQETLALCAVGINAQKPIADSFTALVLFDNPQLHLLSAKAHVDNQFSSDQSLGAIPKREPRARVRIGYYSADLYYHPVSIWLAEQLENHDKSKVELYAFCLKSVQDPMRNRLEAAFDHWIDVQSMSDLEIAKLSRELEIDIAIDLNGHTADGRTGIFAARAAPIQVSHLGFPGSMGAEYIDYMMGQMPSPDEDLQELERNRQFITEKIAYVPSGFTYDRQRQISEVLLTRTQYGLPEAAFVFTCQNGLKKLVPEVFDIWMDILKAVPGSVLWLQQPSDTAVKNLIKEANARGVEGERLIFTAREVVPKDQEKARIGRYLASYRLADLFLDTWPYNAGTTAIDALWAGLPVLTKMGKAYVARMAAEALRAIEVPELITRTPQAYQELAIELAQNPEKLIQLKDKVQRNRLTTALFDPVENTRHIENAYLEMYKRYQKGIAPEYFMTKLDKKKVTSK
jgi:predicted O-linked N-acetylglucosamine transferase (SPINDLY family)